MKQIPKRTCVACKKKFDKKELLRIVRVGENEVKVDLLGKMQGRGAYICKNSSCVDHLIKKKKLNEHLLINLTDEMYEHLEKEVNGYVSSN